MPEDAINNMTDEELRALIKKAKGGEGEPGGKPNDPPPEVTIQLEDGSTITAANHEELNRLLVAKLQEYRATEEPPKATSVPPAKPDWNLKTFTDKFLADPREGLDFLDMAETGISTRKVLPALLVGVSQMAQRLQELETQQFLDATPEYEPSGENRAALEAVLKERGWTPSRQTLEDAYYIARGRGKIKAKEAGEGKPERKPFVPPRTGGSRTPEPTPEEIREAAEGMTTEQLRETLVKAGFLRG